MLASSQTDLLLGIDVHWELVPMPAPTPMPLPNPFTGMVFDPMGLAAGLAIGAVVSAATGAPFAGPVVYWGAFPATNTGTQGIHVPGHILIPPGTAWAPVPRTPRPVIHPGETPKPPKPITPDDDAVIITGSKTVHVMGTNAVRMGDLALSCSEPIRLPSTVVVAIPKGPPILIGGPPALDFAAAVMGSLRTRFVGDSLQALLSRMRPSRFRSVLRWLACFATGHPVDVASGKVLTSKVDAELPGPLPLKVERVYMSSFASRGGSLGHGWSLSLEQFVWTERGRVVLQGEDGREIEFDTFDLPERRLPVGHELYHPIERLTLRRERDGRWIVLSHDGTRREFFRPPGRSDGRAVLQRMVSRCGNHQIVFAYDEQGRLASVRDSARRTIELGRDGRGRVVSLILPHPDEPTAHLHRRYEYDAQGDLVRVVDSLGHSWQFEYVTHLLVRETDRTGLSFYFQYDGLGEDAWCTRTWGDGGIHDHSLTYDRKNHVTYVKDSLGNTTQYQMNVAGLVTRIVDPLGGERRFEYDPASLRRVAEVDATGRRSERRHDERGNLIELRGPGGGGVRVTYHPRWNVPVAAVDPQGHQWSWTVGESGELESITNPLARATRFHFQDGLLRALGDEVTFHHDQQGLMTRVRRGGVETTLERDRRGRIVRLGRGAEVERRLYDLEGNVTLVHRAGVVSTFEHDEEGNLLVARSAGREVTLRYSGLHRLAERSEDGTSVRFHHDREGRLLAVENEAGERHEFERDERGLPVRERAFDGAETRYQRDGAGRVVKVGKAGGVGWTVAHDPAGRPAEVRYQDGGFTRYRYQADGAVVQIANPAATVTLERDALGRITRESSELADGRVEWVKSEHSASGRRLRVSDSDGSGHSVQRTAAGAVEKVTLAGGWTVEFERDGAGLELTRRLPGQVSSRWTRDGRGRPLRQILVHQDRTLADSALSWGAGDLLLEVGGTRLEYDPRGRLVKARRAGEVELRTMDAVGNVFRTADASDRRYGPGGRLVEMGQTSFSYDGDGNLVRRQGAEGERRYRWDHAGLLREVELPDGRAVQYEYDGLARRVGKRIVRGAVCERETKWSWDGDLPRAELDSESGKTSWLFEPESGRLLAQVSGDEIFSAETDQVGAPTALVDARGAVAWRAEFGIHGPRAVAAPRTTCPLRWPGQMADDDVGLLYNRWRYYDPGTDRYLSRDPLGPFTGTNPYRYVFAPLTWIDPLGLAPFFRGTTEGFPGGPGSQSVGISPVSTHPGVATVFAAGASSSHGAPGVVMVFTEADLAGVEMHPGNWLADIEREVGVGLAPAQLAERASVVVPLAEARAILQDMGIDVPLRVELGETSDLCRSMRDMTEAEIDTFVQRARERSPPPHCGG